MTAAYPGEFVRWDDYARLKAEVERLTERNKFLEQIDSYLQEANENAYEKRCDELESEVERLTALVESNLNSYKVAMGKADAVLHERDSLKAEVERLRKAGDAMAKRTEFFQKRWDADELCQEVEDWYAAKEGKQS